MYKREVLRMTDYEMLEKLKNCRCGSHNLTIEYIYSRGIYNIYCNDCENEIFVKGQKDKAIEQWGGI
jgi:hypothetical protein